MRKIPLLLLFWLLNLATPLWAQCFLAFNAQNQPVKTFCVGERITFKDNSGQSNVDDFYDFDDRDGPNFPTQEKSHTFTTPGTYVISQLTGVGNICSIKFEVKAADPAAVPFLQKLTVQAGAVQLQLSTSGINDLVVERAALAAGPFTALETLPNVPAGESQHSIKVNEATGCLRVRVINSCSGRADLVSNVVCVQSLTVTAGDRRNELRWEAATSTGHVVNYQILRGGQSYQNQLGTQTSFTDLAVACGRTYTYQLVALLGNGAQSVSFPVQVVTQGTSAPATPFLVASFNTQNQVSLQTIVPAQETFKEQRIFRSLNNGTFGQLLEKQPLLATDTSLPGLVSPLCYQASYTDSCDQVSPRSLSACPFILTASLDADGSVQLTWNGYEGFPEGVASQTLELLDEQNTVYWSIPVSGQSYLDTQPQKNFQRLRYRLVSQAQNLAYESASNLAVVDQAFQFYFPTAFTPNNDGLNDVFRAVGAPFASKFTLQVLNRWGQIIFEGKDPSQGWDGTFAGKPAPPETYIYRFEAIDVNGKRITQKGTITLIR